jgi:Flp pilus assembly protein TadD
MPRRSFAHPAVLIAVAFILLASYAQAQPGRVGGIVKDEDGKPLKGATILAENKNIGQNFTATTDDKGRFMMLGLRPGAWRFFVQAPGHAADGVEMVVRTAGALNPGMSFALRRTSPPPSAALGNMTAKDLQAELVDADGLFNQQKWDEAIAAYRGILAKTPGLAVINLQIAAALRNKRDLDGALDAYNSLLKLDPTSQKAVMGIVATRVDKGDIEGAIQALSEAAAGPSAGGEVFDALGDFKLRQGQPSEADAWYQRAADADPGWGRPRYKLGMSALTRGDAGAAAGFLAQVIAVDPVSTEAADAKTELDKLNK